VHNSIKTLEHIHAEILKDSRFEKQKLLRKIIIPASKKYRVFEAITLTIKMPGANTQGK